MSFVSTLEHYCNLPENTQKDINTQVRQVVIYYLGFYLELIEAEDGGASYEDLGFHDVTKRNRKESEKKKKAKNK